jgi:hypothetical protein
MHERVLVPVPVLVPDIETDSASLKGPKVQQVADPLIGMKVAALDRGCSRIEVGNLGERMFEASMSSNDTR